MLNEFLKKLSFNPHRTPLLSAAHREWLFGAIIGSCIASILFAVAPWDVVLNPGALTNIFGVRVAEYLTAMGPGALGAWITALGFVVGGVAHSFARPIADAKGSG
jgi:hypothetical protein